jgi:dolichol-phosphate mannosyltransferase
MRRISPELHGRLTAVCQSLALTYELIFVDDGSPDGTWRVIRAIAEKDPHASGLLLSRNHGHQIAVTAGLRHSRGERVLIIDSDLEDPRSFFRK